MESRCLRFLLDFGEKRLEDITSHWGHNRWDFLPTLVLRHLIRIHENERLLNGSEIQELVISSSLCRQFVL